MPVSLKPLHFAVLARFAVNAWFPPFISWIAIVSAARFLFWRALSDQSILNTLSWELAIVRPSTQDTAAIISAFPCRPARVEISDMRSSTMLQPGTGRESPERSIVRKGSELSSSRAERTISENTTQVAGPSRQHSPGSPSPSSLSARSPSPCCSFCVLIHKL